MNKVLESATSHFRTKLTAELHHIEVPEWGTKVWFKNAVTLREQSRLIELSSQGKQVEALVESLIVKARNEDGTKMFALADKMTFLNEVDPQVIIRLVGEINRVSDDTQSMDEIEKN